MLLCVDHAVALYFGAQQSSPTATAAAASSVRRDSTGTSSSSTSSSTVRHSGLSPRPAVRSNSTDRGRSSHNGRSCNGKNCSNGSPSSQRLCTPHQHYCSLSEEVCINTAPLLVSNAAANLNSIISWHSTACNDSLGGRVQTVSISSS
jgi:hypothetical protein